ncbi:conjugal transfer protein TraL [Aeromonas salmonicida]|uniref:conjugal transfer protein TraL n=1 Tax=Aeromonas salmonicida TaxID=645 RepID=UPI0030A61471
MNNTVHFILQGKGGIGKSFVASLLAQYIKDHINEQLLCFDTDQENTTFAHYKDLNVKHIHVMNNDRTINRKMFDSMMEGILSSDENIVIDNGANTFSPLMAYIIENGVIEMLRDMGKKVFIHTIVGGGDTLKDTTSGFVSVSSSTQAPLIIWLNEHFGSTGNFSESRDFKDNAKNVRDIINLQQRNADTFGDDIKRMNTARKTLKEVLESDKFTIMEKQRIKTVMRDVFQQLDEVEWQ